MKYLIFCLLILFGSWSCYQPRVGCLDPEAANYDVSADENCINPKNNSCTVCQYRSLRLNLQPFWNDDISVKEGFQTSSIILQSASFFMTDFQLVKSDGTIVEISDSVKILVKKSNLDTMTKKIRNDIALVNLKDTLYKAGEIKQTGTFVKLKFRLGLNDNARQADLKKVLPSPHPLRDSSVYEKYNRYFARFSVVNDKINKPNITTVYTWDNKDTPITSERIEIIFKKPIYVEPGRDALVKLNVFYGKWFANVDFKQPESEVLKKLIANIPNAFVQ